MFAGTGRLTRLILRRDRIKLPVWILIIVGFSAMMVVSLKGAYGTVAEWQSIYEVINSNPAGKMLAGLMDEPSFGALFTIETVLYVGLLIAFMNVLLVVRHTRQNEDLGSSELMLSGQVGRGAALSAVLIVALLANSIIGLSIGASLASEPLLSTSGAWLYGIGMGIFGLVFATVAAITAQLASSSRGANSMAAIVIGIAFFLRGIGDMLSTTNSAGLPQPNWLSWLSPFGWLQQTRPLTVEHWWPLLISIGFIVAGVIAAYALLARRDIGAGILAARKGPERLGSFKRTPIGFAVYLQRNVFIGWLIGTLIMTIATGMLSNQVSDVYSQSEVIQQYIAAQGGLDDLTASFISAMLVFVAIVALAYVLQSLNKLRSEEITGHLESLLGTTLGRTKWLLSHVSVVMLGGTIIMLLSGIAMSISVGMATSASPSEWQLTEYVLAALSYIPLLALFTGLYVLFVGTFPRLASVALWLAFAFVVFISQLGGILQLSKSFMDLSPLSHIAVAPAATIVLRPLLVMSAIALVTLVFGMLALKRRDIAAR